VKALDFRPPRFTLDSELEWILQRAFGPLTWVPKSPVNGERLYAQSARYADGSAHNESGFFEFERNAIDRFFPPPPASILVGGCGGGRGALLDAASEAGASGESDAGFVPAAHSPFPLVTAHGGPVIPQIEVVPVYFGDDPLEAALESFNDWIVGSDHWKTVGADYGVLPGTRLPAAHFDSVPATTMSDTQIAGWIATRVADGSLPKPSAQTLFALFYPAGTTITAVSGTSTSCVGFAGLHQSASIANAIFHWLSPFRHHSALFILSRRRTEHRDRRRLTRVRGGCDESVLI
jgi:hypothetical protein